ncbi:MULTISPECIES: hypothetical protein [Desulfitobacterium]|uniref:Uncharacterized protein n=1 Tax=Desulfitobacterium dehalogenans (strain ATCC 51507 / DSM 9161 / JW/IU-DC1) TaxID=756499 RepID=I4A8Y5_DESDJ|nr:MULTISPECIES: hypothetical protein [Desulfitobacterium]AFM00420.1 hypothetical protein Desde_2036 [Desulfitobacterium dehalogenans ATCC 51507]
MLSKLMKYELKATGRVFLPLFLALLVFGLINRFMLGVSASHQWQTPAIISMAVYIFIMVGMFVMTLIMTLQRFYKNLLSEEGYLMFTLPVKPWQHIVCKMTISLFWLVLSFFVAILSIVLIAFKPGDWEHIMREIMNLGKVLDYFGSSVYLYSLEGILGIIIVLTSAVLILYASIAVGHLFTQHRILASFAAFIGLNTITQIISMGITYVVGYNFHNLQVTSENFLTMQSELHLFIVYLLIESALITAAYFAITNHILKKRLNLE